MTIVDGDDGGGLSSHMDIVISMPYMGLVGATVATAAPSLLILSYLMGVVSLYIC